MNVLQDNSMRVALAKFEMFFPYCHSLKEKRHLLHKLKARVFADYKVPVHEVDHHDKWQRAQLGLAVVGNDATLISSVVDKITGALEDVGVGELVDRYVEVISF